METLYYINTKQLFSFHKLKIKSKYDPFYSNIYGLKNKVIFMSQAIYFK